MDGQSIVVGLVLCIVAGLLCWATYLIGRQQQSAFDRRYELRQWRQLMADFSRLNAAIDALPAAIAAKLAQPHPEDPAIQAGIDAAAAKAEAVLASVQPPA